MVVLHTNSNLFTCSRRLHWSTAGPTRLVPAHSLIYNSLVYLQSPEPDYHSVNHPSRYHHYLFLFSFPSVIFLVAIGSCPASSHIHHQFGSSSSTLSTITTTLVVDINFPAVWRGLSNWYTTIVLVTRLCLSYGIRVHSSQPRSFWLSCWAGHRGILISSLIVRQHPRTVFCIGPQLHSTHLDLFNHSKEHLIQGLIHLERYHLF